MKNKLRIAGLLAISIFLACTACKKNNNDDDQLSPKAVNGTFHAFEVTMNGTTTPFPTEDEKMDVIIKSTGNNKAKVTITDYYKGDTTVLPSVSCTFDKDPDGLLYLSGTADGGDISVDFWDKNAIDVNLFVTDTRQTIEIGASRNGKKPSDW